MIPLLFFTGLLLSLEVPDEAIVLRPAVIRRGPWVVSQRAGHDPCPVEDPLGPCPSQIYVVNNPLRAPVRISLDCGFDLERPTFRMDPESTVAVEVTAHIPGGPSCLIGSWTKERKGRQ